MRSLRSRLSSKPSAPGTVIDVRQAGQRILTEYVLNMAVSALAHADITPLYDHYMDDPRLSDEDREELARAYLLLQMTATQAPDVPSAHPARRRLRAPDALAASASSERTVSGPS